MAQNNANQGRLYTRFISVLKILQYVGYFVVVFFSFIMVFLTGGALPTGFSPLLLIPLLVQTIVGCIMVYVITQGLIAIVDLLSRIEQNTRSS
jgi:NADH:ubiquinone oxidoreductase subunit 6 (subunit J)